MKKHSFIVNEDDIDRIDRLVSVKLNSFTRSRAQLLCQNDQVFVNSKPVSKNFVPKEGDSVEVLIEEDDNTPKPENIDLDVVYEDEYLAVINKPKGMLVHSSSHQNSGTLVNALLYKYGDRLSTFGEDFRPGIVHRLDKDTSGLLIVAFDNDVHRTLSRMLQKKKISRKYKAVVYGVIDDDKQEINAPIGRDPITRVQMAVVPNGRKAITYCSVIDRFKKFTLVELELETGRTNQIRVHMEHIGYPVAGDAVYKGNRKVITNLNGQCLHAHELSFVHPITNEDITITADLPVYFSKFLKEIGND